MYQYFNAYINKFLQWLSLIPGILSLTRKFFSRIYKGFKSDRMQTCLDNRNFIERGFFCLFCASIKSSFAMLLFVDICSLVFCFVLFVYFNIGPYVLTALLACISGIICFSPIADQQLRKVEIVCKKLLWLIAQACFFFSQKSSYLHSLHII